MYPHCNTVHVHMVSTCHWLSRPISHPALLLFLTQRKGFHSAAQQTIISFFMFRTVNAKTFKLFCCFIYIYLQWLVQFNSAVNKQIFPGCRSCTPLFTNVKVIQQKIQFNNSRRYKQNVTGLYKLQAKCSEGIGG